MVDAQVKSSDENRGALPASPSKDGHFNGQLTDYWYQGKAELTTYDLEQARYGELHPGEAILIQVSEDFLTDKQVKNDNYTNPNTTPIIKTNLFKRFTTGIYDYSIMSSVFTPTKTDEQPHTLKVTTSLQDWCGQTFTQLNFNGEAWAMQLRSYFENEGDQNEALGADWLEDEVFNRIRTGGKLPTGTYELIPNTGYLLMTHQPYRAAKAEISLREGDPMVYVIDYPDLKRRLEVSYDAEPPHVIRGWTETYPSRGNVLTTTATLREQTMKAYWGLNGTKDQPLRADLGL